MFVLPGGIGQIKASAPPSAWNPLDKVAAAVLSANNTVVSGSGANSCGVRGVKSRASGTGSWYFTMTYGVLVSPTGNSACGLGTATANISSPSGGAGIANSNVWSQFSSGGIKWQAYNGTTQVAGLYVGNNAARTMNFAWASNGDLFLGLEGTWYDTLNNPTPTPVTPVMNITGTMFPIAWVYSGTADALTLNTNPAGTPAGYTNWG